MKASTLFGILCGILSIFGAFIWEGGTSNSLFLLPAMLIVFGGTFAAGLAGSSFEQFGKIPKVLKIVLSPPRYNLEEIANQIVGFAALARRQGILALEAQLGKVKHPFLKKLMEVCIDGADPDTLLDIIGKEMNYITQRHNSNINLFVKMGGYSPTMGIIGTVMGLIATLASAGKNPTELIHHIATAFIATMWGIFLANIVLLPIGDKLRTLHNEEMQVLQVMLDGVYAVLLGETPTVIRSRLASAFTLKEQANFLKKKEIIPKRIPFETKVPEPIIPSVPESQPVQQEVSLS
jgi:chemotaxis protein MotA